MRRDPRRCWHRAWRQSRCRARCEDGPGIPEEERAVVTREVDIDQLSHSQGLGLRFDRWVMDAYDGEFVIDSDEEGTAVKLRLPAARN